MKPDLTLYATDLRRAASDLEAFTEADKVLLGCLVIADSLGAIRRAIAGNAPEANLMEGTTKSASSIRGAISNLTAYLEQR
jgi:hypothetical protein